MLQWLRQIRERSRRLELARSLPRSNEVRMAPCCFRRSMAPNLSSSSTPASFKKDKANFCELVYRKVLEPRDHDRVPAAWWLRAPVWPVAASPADEDDSAHHPDEMGRRSSPVIDGAVQRRVSPLLGSYSLTDAGQIPELHSSPRHHTVQIISFLAANRYDGGQR